MKRRMWLLIFIVFTIIGVSLYASFLDNSFHYDDYNVISHDEKNHNESHLLDVWTTVFYGNIVSPGRGHYRPLVFTTYLLNYLADGMKPRGYHAVNLLIHILTAFMVALIMEQLTGQLMVSWLSGILFLVHPFNSEAVNYVTARSSSLYALFYLLAFYAYMRYRPPLAQVPLNPPFLKGETISPPSSKSGDYELSLFQRGSQSSPPLEKGGWGALSTAFSDESKDKVSYPKYWLIIFLLSFVLSMLSKEMAVTMPVTIFLYEWLVVPDSNWKDRLRYLWIPAVSGIVVTVSYLSLRSILSGAALPSGMSSNLMSQLATESVVLVKTIGLILWPANLTIDHLVEVYETFATWPVAGACIVLVVLFCLFLWLALSGDRRKRIYAFLLAWFFAVLSPLVFLHLNAMLQENRAYLATAGVTGLAAIGIVWILDWGKRKKPIYLKAAWTGIVVLVLIYAVLTFQRNRVWKDEVTLWSDAVKKEPYSPLSRNNMGTAFEHMGMLEQAAEQYRYSWTIKPTDPVTVYNLGVIMQKQGLVKEAGAWYRVAFRLSPGFYSSRLKIGKQYEKNSRWDDAIQVYRQASLLWPDGPEAHLFLADALLHIGHRDEASNEYRIALQKNPDDDELRTYVQERLKQAGNNSGQRRVK